MKGVESIYTSGEEAIEAGSSKPAQPAKVLGRIKIKAAELVAKQQCMPPV
jgi:hypothetical protein